MKPRLKTPITYYGGKQNLVSTILPLIPDHELYAEPFVGGGAVFWAKEPSKVEIINDLNGEIINFYKVMQTRFDELYELVHATLHSRKLHSDSAVIYNNPHLFSPVDRAWALWLQCNQSFSSKICGGWAYGKKGNSCEKKTHNTKERFKAVFKDRLKTVQIECNDALRIIQSRDREGAFFYCDPPYPKSDQGHYKGYSMEDFMGLIEALSSIKGRFLVSSYDYTELAEMAQKNGWNQYRKEMKIAVNKRPGSKLRTQTKVEVFTANYPLG